MRKKKTRRRAKSKLTLEQVVQAAVEAGASVSISLPPLLPMPTEPPRPMLRLTEKDLPGDITCRSTMAAMDYTKLDVDRVFKDNPSSRYVVTPYEVFERGNPVPIKTVASNGTA